jgi:hypothetical protein
MKRGMTMILRLILISVLFSISSLVVGSATYSNKFQLNDKDRVTGHVYFKNGCVIGDKNDSRVVFDINGLVTGDMTFKGDKSRLVLESDLTLGSSVSLFQPTIEAHGQQIKLTGDVVQRDLFSVAGDLTINGQGNILEMADKSSFSLIRDNKVSSTLRLKNMTLLVSGNGNRKSLVNGIRGTLELDNVTIVLQQRCVFDELFINFRNRVDIRGPGQELLLDCPQNFSGVLAGATLYVGHGVIFTPQLHDKNNFCCADPSATFWFDGCIIRPFFMDGWQLTCGKVIFENNVVIENEGLDVYQKGVSHGALFELGNDGVHEVETVLMPGAQVTVNGYLYHNPL